jgi:hypothetical protein
MLITAKAFQAIVLSGGKKQLQDLDYRRAPRQAEDL